MRRLWPAFALPFVLTAATLAEVTWNRSSGRGPIVLTERELRVPRASDDNSARRAWIAFQYRADERRWLPRDALAALGFDLSVDPARPEAARHYGRMLPRDAWVALELGGPAFAALPADIRANGSRLVPIDASRDAATLVARYRDPARYLVTAAVVRVVWQDPPDGPPQIRLGVDSIAPPALHVARAVAPALAGEHYRVSVVYGRRFEPWIVGASP